MDIEERIDKAIQEYNSKTGLYPTNMILNPVNKFELARSLNINEYHYEKEFQFRQITVLDNIYVNPGEVRMSYHLQIEL